MAAHSGRCSSCTGELRSHFHRTSNKRGKRELPLLLSVCTFIDQDKRKKVCQAQLHSHRRGHPTSPGSVARSGPRSPQKPQGPASAGSITNSAQGAQPSESRSVLHSVSFNWPANGSHRAHHQDSIMAAAPGFSNGQPPRTRSDGRAVHQLPLAVPPSCHSYYDSEGPPASGLY